MEVCLCYNLQTNYNKNIKQIESTAKCKKKKQNTKPPKNPNQAQKANTFSSELQSLFSAPSTIFPSNLTFLFSKYSYFSLVKMLKCSDTYRYFFF